MNTSILYYAEKKEIYASRKKVDAYWMQHDYG